MLVEEESTIRSRSSPVGIGVPWSGRGVVHRRLTGSSPKSLYSPGCHREGTGLWSVLGRRPRTRRNPWTPGALSVLRTRDTPHFGPVSQVTTFLDTSEKVGPGEEDGNS